MKISWYKRQSRRKGQKNIFDIYLRFNTKPITTQRMHNTFLYKKPTSAEETRHNDNEKIRTNKYVADMNLDERQGILNIPDLKKQTDSVVQWGNNYIDVPLSEMKRDSKNAYIQGLKLFEQYFGKHKTFVTTKIEDIENWKKWLKNKAVTRYGHRYTTATLNTYMNRVKVIFEEANNRGVRMYKREIPFKKVKNLYFKEEKVIKEYINTDEFVRLDWRYCTNQETAKAFMFSILTGLRTSDIRSLTWKDVKKERDAKTDEYINYSYIKMVKGQEPIRVLYPDICMELMGKRGARDERIFKYSLNVTENEKLKMWLLNTFPNKRIGEKGGGLTFHSGRASYITNMLLLGVSPVKVQHYVGHKDLKTTLRYYRGSGETQWEDIQEYSNVLKTKRATMSV